MRSATLMYAGFMFIILELAILSSVISRSVYNEDMQSSLESSVELSMHMLQEGQAEKIINESSVIPSSSLYESVNGISDSDLDDFKKGFVECLVKNLDSRVDDVTVDIYGADDLHGLLSVEVTAKFEYFSGNQGSVSCYRTMIYDKQLKSVKKIS